MATSTWHVIVDRDGVLNVERPNGGFVVDWSHWEWLPGAIAGLRTLSALGAWISVVTNQSCIGRGLVGKEEVDNIHARMIEEARFGDAQIHRVFVCPHSPDDACYCRKPAPGMLLHAVTASGIPAEATFAVGDAIRDVEAARAAGIRAVLVRTGKGLRSESALSCRGVPTFDNLRDFAEALGSNSHARG
ncbi:MAG: HAD-IIIA family hydrolase [Gemmatimonadaceae bacterium]